MNRREALKLVGFLMGGAVSSSVASAVLSGCMRQRRTGAYTPQTLTDAQDELVATVAELILPATDTPGARAAKVNAFVDGMLTTIFSERERERFLAGLADLDTRAEAAAGTTFVALAPEEQTAILGGLASEAVSTPTSDDEQPFFLTMKELTLVGYYTSEIGATQELQYVHAAGRYDGDVPLAEAGRAYA